VRTKLKNVGSGAVLDKTFRAGEKVRPIRTETRRMQYLYESGEEAVLMDLGDYEQVSLPKQLIGQALDWMLPNDEVDVLFVDERPADVQVPSAVEMAVTRTDPGVRGDTASGGGTKPATLESGVTVQVPLFVNEGDRVRVDTRTREYVARA
jgi:elongation factor P